MMQHDPLQKRLDHFAAANQQLLADGKNLMTLLEGPHAARMVDKPLLLKLILEKYLELIEERLIPELAGGRVADTPAPAARTRAAAPTAAPDRDVLDDSLDRSDHYHICTPHHVDDFRGTDPGFRPVARPAQMPRTPRAAAPVSPPPAPRQAPPPKAAPMAAQAGRLAPVRPREMDMQDTHPGHRRVAPRYSCHMPLAYCVEGLDKNMLKAYSRDVGALGLFILSNRPQKAGDMIKIQVEMPDHRKALLRAVVRWTKWVPQNLRAADMPGFGVRITDAPEAWYTYFMNEPHPSHAHL